MTILSRSVNQVLTIMAKTLKLTHKLGIQQAIAATRKDVNHNNNDDKIISLVVKSMMVIL